VVSGARGGPLEPGEFALVLSGVLANQVGAVVETDNKGGARLAIGLLQVRVLLRDLQKVVREK
jgi:hypothetical protein